MNDQNDPRNNHDNGSGEGGPEGPNPWIKSLMIWGGIFVALLLVVSMMSGNSEPAGAEMPYSEFREKVAEGSIKSADVGPEQITGITANNEQFVTTRVAGDDTLTQLLEDNGVSYSGVAKEEPNVLLYVLLNSLPFLLILGIAGFWQIQSENADRASGPRNF